MRRFSIIFLPFLAAFALVFGLYYLYAAVRLVQLGRAVEATLVFLFGVVGVALAVGIWVARRRFRARATSDASQPPA